MSPHVPIRYYKEDQVRAIITKISDDKRFGHLCKKLTLDVLCDLLGDEEPPVAQLSAAKTGRCAIGLRSVRLCDDCSVRLCIATYFTKAAFSGENEPRPPPAMFNIFEPGHGKHGDLPRRPAKKYKGVPDDFAIRKCGFEDEFMLVYMKAYLKKNGDFMLRDVSAVKFWCVRENDRLHTGWCDCRWQQVRLTFAGSGPR